MAALLIRDRAALREGLHEVLLDLRVGGRIAEIDGVFKVQIQAAEIQIDRADDRLNTVGQIDLRVDEAGRILDRKSVV